MLFKELKAIPSEKGLPLIHISEPFTNCEYDNIIVAALNYLFFIRLTLIIKLTKIYKGAETIYG